MAGIFPITSEALVLCCPFDLLRSFSTVRLDKEFNSNEILNFLVKIFPSHTSMGDSEHSKDPAVRVRFLEMSLSSKVSCWCGFIHSLPK